jgi:hypothetical protein
LLFLERREILLQVPNFIPSLVNVSVAYHWLNTTTMCMNLYAQLVQAVPSLDYPAMQLPGIDIEQAKMLMEKGISGQGWQKKVVGDAEVEKLIGDEGIRIAKEFPQLHVSAKFEGELLLNNIWTIEYTLIACFVLLSRGRKQHHRWLPLSICLHRTSDCRGTIAAGSQGFSEEPKGGGQGRQGCCVRTRSLLAGSEFDCSRIFVVVSFG